MSMYTSTAPVPATSSRTPVADGPSSAAPPGAVRAAPEDRVRRVLLRSCAAALRRGTDAAARALRRLRDGLGADDRAGLDVAVV